jgi:uncharacterized Zn finger protein (UPF0148 family)
MKLICPRCGCAKFSWERICAECGQDETKHGELHDLRKRVMHQRHELRVKEETLNSMHGAMGYAFDAWRRERNRAMHLEAKLDNIIAERLVNPRAGGAYIPRAGREITS